MQMETLLIKDIEFQLYMLKNASFITNLKCPLSLHVSLEIKQQKYQNSWKMKHSKHMDLKFDIFIISR